MPPVPSPLWFASTAAAAGLSYVEQPLPPAADDALAAWPAADVPVVVDESVVAVADVARLASSVAAAPVGVNVKPARLGGLRAALAVLDACRAVGHQEDGDQVGRLPVELQCERVVVI